VQADINLDEEKTQYAEMSQNHERMQTILNNWRAEFDHPCVVSKSRRKVATTMQDVF